MKKTVIDYLKLNSEKYGEKPAVVCEGNHITFKELYDMVRRKADDMAGECEKADVLTIENKRSIETIVLMLSAVVSGKVYRVVNSLDETSRESKFRNEDCSLPMYEICTSGTTGEPKRILRGQGELLEFIEDFVEKFNLGDNDVFLNQLEFTFDASTKDIYCMVVLGATLHIASRKQINFPTEFVKYVSENNITIFITTPFYIKNIARMNGLYEMMHTRLKYVMFVGESLRSEYLNYWIEHMPSTNFVNLYGSSELAGNSLYYIINDEVKSEFVPLKDCFLDYRYHIEEGQLVLERSSRQLVYETGDMAEVSDDDIFIIGRCDNIRKLRGYRISLENIEKEVAQVLSIKEALCEQHDDSMYVVFTSDAENLDVRLLQKELKDRLPRYVWPLRLKQVEKLPVNNNGKLERNRVIEYFSV